MDGGVVALLQELAVEKQKAVMSEEYDEAKRIKARIDQLREVHRSPAPASPRAAGCASRAAARGRELPLRRRIGQPRCAAPARRWACS